MPSIEMGEREETERIDSEITPRPPTEMERGLPVCILKVYSTVG